MADSDEVVNVNENNDEEMEVNQDPQNNQSGDNLRDFVYQRYQEQRDAGSLSNSEGVSNERTMQFFNRAMSESQRMSSEVSRSEERQQQLYQELGAQNVHAWTMEHASEVTVTLDENGQLAGQQNGHVMNGHDTEHE